MRLLSTRAHHQQHDDRADHGIDDRGDEAAADEDAERGSSQPPTTAPMMPTMMSPISPKPPPVTICAGEPAGNRADDEPNDDDLNWHGIVLPRGPQDCHVMPLRQAARDTGRLGRLPQSDVSVFRVRLPQQRRCLTNAAAAAAHFRTAPRPRVVLGCRGAQEREPTAGSAGIFGRNGRARRRSRHRQGRSHGSDCRLRLPCIAAVLIGFVDLRPRLPLDLEPHGARRVRPQGDHLLAGASAS